MFQIKTMKQIPTARAIRSFRSGGSRLSWRSVDEGRIRAGHAQMQFAEARRQWLREMISYRDLNS